MIHQLDIRTFLLLILNPLGCLLLFIFGALKVKDAKSRNPFIIILSLFFFSVGIGILVNILYASFSASINDSAYIFFGRISAGFITLGTSFLVLFMYAIYIGFSAIQKPEKYGFILFIALYFILVLFLKGTTLTEERFMSYSLGYFFLVFSYITAVLFCLVILFILNRRKFTDPNLKKRFTFFFIGAVLILGILYITALANAELLPRQISSAIFLSLLIPSTILVFYGIAK